MLMKKSVGPAILMVFLLLYPRFAAEGARYGLLLWYTSVVPSLFPFMVLSSLIVSSGGVSLLMKPVRAFLSPWLPLSENGCYTLVSGLLCGCPMGAKTCGDFVREGKLSVQEGRFLMAICNHPSPMFLLGFVCPLFEAEMHPSRLLLSIYLPLLPLAALAKRIYFPVRKGGRNRTAKLHPLSPAPGRPSVLGLPSPAFSGSRPQVQTAPALDTAILAAAEILCRIGGYLMLFSIVIVFLRRAPWLPASLRLFLIGAMEMTTGVREVSASLPFPDSGTAAAAILAFGGICGVFQTRAVTASGRPEEKKSRTDDAGGSPKESEGRTKDKKIAGLSIRQYILWKLLHSALAAVIFRLLGTLG